MKTLKSKSIQSYWKRRVLFPTMVICIITVLCSFYYLKEVENYRATQYLENIAKKITTLVYDRVNYDNYGELTDIVYDFGKTHDVMVRIVSPDGIVVASYPSVMNMVNSGAKNEKAYVTNILLNDESKLGTISISLPKYSDYKITHVTYVGIIALIILIFFIQFWSSSSIKLLVSEISKLSNYDKTFSSTYKFLEAQSIHNTLLDKIEIIKKYERDSVTAVIAHQVAHDIRSPLAALEVSLNDVKQLPEYERIMVRSAINRIKDIANNLIEKNREITTASEVKTNQVGDEPIATHLLSSHIEPLITEKRMQYRSKIGIQIDCNLEASYGLFAKVKATEFKRVLSNLINNSVEALGDRGAVMVSLTGESDGKIKIGVQDNGNGIPPDVLAKLGQRGETHGKVGGSGLGLYHARTSVESWGGSFEIQSVIGKGTCVNITLLQARAPDWFVSQLDFNINSTVVILDDDTSIHLIWQGRFNALSVDKNAINILHMSTPEELAKWVHDNGSENAIFLVDYEYIGIKETGLDIIKSLNISKQSILVTSRYEESHVMEGCKQLRVRLIPKGLAGFVPINIGVHSKPSDQPATEINYQLQYILIDDDELVQNMWKLMAKKAGKSFLGFTAPTDFFKILDKVSKSASIYIDSSLGDGIKGEDIAKQLYELGFSNLYMASGYKKDHFSHLTFLRGVQGKDPPF